MVSREFTTYFRSVIVFGRAHALEEDNAKREALVLLAAKYSPADGERRTQEVEKGFQQVCMVELAIEHISGKEATELKKQRGN